MTDNEDMIIEAFDLTKAADGDFILDGVSFSFGRRGVHGILSPKGGGKTALLDILACAKGYDGGELVIDGIRIPPCGADGKQAKEAKTEIGYVRQNSEFYPQMTPVELLNFIGSARGEAPDKLTRQIKEALELVGLEGVSNRLIGRLELTEQKMLGYAAAIVGNPEILIIDEPKSKLTAGNMDTVKGIVRLFGKRKTVIIATEDFKIARELCDDIVIISDGSVLASGSFEELEDKLASRDDGRGTTLEALYNSLARASAGSKRKVGN